MDFNFRVPEVKNPAITESDCSHYSYCKSLGITTNDCLDGASYVRRCNQGNFAQIQLLSKIIERLSHDTKE